MAQKHVVELRPPEVEVALGSSPCHGREPPLLLGGFKRLLSLTGLIPQTVQCWRLGLLGLGEPVYLVFLSGHVGHLCSSGLQGPACGQCRGQSTAGRNLPGLDLQLECVQLFLCGGGGLEVSFGRTQCVLQFVLTL